MNSFEFTGREVAEATVERSRRRWKNVAVMAACTALLVVLLVVVHKKTSSSGQTPMDLGEQSTATDLEEVENPPTAVPTNQERDPESLSTSDVNCDQLYDCQTDRLGHEMPLYAGQAICNEQYRFGLTPEGVFLWHDCDTDEKKIVYDPSGGATVRTFVMSERGGLRLEGEDLEIVWQKNPTLKIVPTTECLHHPVMDCPYLHLHKSGDVVLNSIDPNTNGWSDRKIQRCFENFFQ